MRLEDLIRGVDVREVRGTLDREVARVCFDSREVSRGALFVALRGVHGDGHAHLREAVERGASVLVVERIPDVVEGPALSMPSVLRQARDERDVEGSVTVLTVPESRSALALLAANFFGNPAEGLHLIGVTGTNGKTTMTYLIRSILEAAGERCGLIGTVSYATGRGTRTAPYTTPEPMELHGVFREMADDGCRFVAMEVSSHALALERVHGCRFDAAVFTNLTRDHLDFHADMEDYFQAKTRLFHPPLLRRRAVVCGDDAYGRRLLAETPLPVWSYGIEAPWDIRAENLAMTLEGTRFDAVTPVGTFPVQSRLVGRFNVANLLGSVGAALSLGIASREIAQGIRAMERVPGRMEKIDEGQDFTVLVDYAHTEDALTRLLQSMEGAADRRILTVFGCGGERDRGKRPRMGRAAALMSDVVILTSDNPRGENPREILTEIEAGVRETIASGLGRAREYRVVEDRRDAVEEAVRMAGRGDMVVIAGKGHETFQIVGDRRIPLDDRETAREAIRKRFREKVAG